ncbi:hypothetical protein FB45DRAFT_987522 [Roridomyces roridus]|uniref:Polysaccharide lyase 14 domain-containing protein n=1 Tax=Roridomyces roridus TaxID=1738132 RepID=A0AAD7CAN7_9AGAR|nr:hypothetical protein FB45DRAFT_987522 [Roridomyces roridus]
MLMALSHLIPVDTFQCGFTACPSLNLEKIDQVALTDEDLGVHRVTSRTSHPLVVPPPESSDSAEPSDSGFPAPAFASRLAMDSASGGATHVVLSYRMMLQSGWEWVKGGKLPGIFGGEGDLSYACTGGRKDNRCKCFNVRPMWRAKGNGELYTYLPLTPHNRDPPSLQNNDYGFSVGCAAFNFDVAVGRWITLAFRVKLNNVGSEDGELELWVDGKSVIAVSGLQLRDSDKAHIKGAHFQTFFGGHSEDWASPKDQRAWFADLTGVVIE